MDSQRMLRFMRDCSLLAVSIMSLSFFSGCAACAQHVVGISNALSMHIQEKHDLADIRQDTREALAEQREIARKAAYERDVEEARINAERERLEAQFCQANQEALQRRIKSNVRETVESKVAFNLEQGMEVGELEVDVEELKRVIDKRENEPLVKTPPKKPCSCCDQPCGCGKDTIRRHCAKCRHKPCEAEKKCGGEEALTKLEQEALEKPPLRPAEIPMKLPVRLTFGFQKPEMEAARIRRVPNVPEALEKYPCDRCRGGSCQCDPPCTDKFPGGPVHTDPDEDDEIQSQPEMPPPPIPDFEASRRAKPSLGWPIDTSVTADKNLSKRSSKPASYRR